MFKSRLFIAAAAAALTLPALAAPAMADEPVLTIENFVGRINITTVPGAKIKVTEKSKSQDVDFGWLINDLTIDGGIDDPDGDKCKGYYGKTSFSFFSKKEKKGSFGGYEDLDDFPKLSITGPEDMTLVIRNAIPFGTAGDLGAADIEMSYCGNLTLGDIKDTAAINVFGSGDIETGNIGALDAKIKGSGDMRGQNVDEANISVVGSGDLELEDVGSAIVKVKGSGDVELGNVKTLLDLESLGSGDVRVDSVGEEFIYAARGSGDLSIDEINGVAEIEVSGSNDVDIDDGQLSSLVVSARGSSDVEFRGTTEMADLTATGSSDIDVDRVTGQSKTKERGSADITVGN